ncbi:MAG: hypothetical protein K6T51_10395 [Rubrobacteraceae bacterium]|nr:hypothetical protein [Rubrobacteraceae bacterium]MCL6439010.1 hypothetical protein [Rubrobacteraceae bacterium]
MSGEELPEVILLADGRGERPENAAGAGDFWYEPEIWSSPLSPLARVLYAGLCSFAGHGEINRQDLRNLLKGAGDGEILRAIGELSEEGLLEPVPGGYRIRSVRERGS